MPETERERRRRGRRSATSQAQPAGGSRAAANHRIGNVAADGEQGEPPSAIGYVGLNPRAREEARALERSSPDQVIASLDRPGAEQRYDTSDERAAFIEEVLGIDFYADMLRFFLALQCLEACDADFREQMADLMRMFRGAELGRYNLERLVFSGHHAGGQMWGDGRRAGELIPDRDLRNLVLAFPDAAAQVRDIMFSACNSEAYISLCAELFPGLQSIWVYEGTSPGVATGSARHIQHWERETRDEGLPAEGERVPARRDGRGHVVIWSREEGLLKEAAGRLIEKPD